MTYRFTAELWMHTGNAAWHFVTLPPDMSDEIDDITGPDARGFGSVRVHVTVGATRWSTSLFPDTKAGAYVLPMKKPVRIAEDLHDGDLVDITIELADV